MRTPLLPHEGSERYTRRRVVFVRPFSLGKDKDVYPAGTYEVETKEEPVERGGYTAHVRTGTMLILASSRGTTSRPVDGRDLDEAILRDADSGAHAHPSANPDRGKADGAALDAQS